MLLCTDDVISDVTEDDRKPPPHWLPHGLHCRLSEDGSVVITDLPNKATSLSDQTSSTGTAYDLCAVVCHIADPKFPDKNNLVSLVRVGASYHRRAAGSAAQQWYIFNDLGVTPVSADEAVWLPLHWKVRVRCIFAL